jgi:hypothetical protein
MSSFRSPSANGNTCPTCHNLKVLPDPFAAHEGDTMPCPACAPADGLLDAVRDVVDAIERALLEAEGPAYRRPRNRVVHGRLSEWAEEAQRWLGAEDQGNPGPDLEGLARGDF